MTNFQATIRRVALGVYVLEGLFVYLMEVTGGLRQILVSQEKMLSSIFSLRGLGTFLAVAPLVLFPILLLVFARHCRRPAFRRALTLFGFFFVMLLHFGVILWAYRFATGFTFDFFWFWYNRSESLITVWRVSAGGLVAFTFLFVLLFSAWFLAGAYSVIKSPRLLFGLCLLLGLSFVSRPLFSAAPLEIENFIYQSFVADRELSSRYQEHYHAHLERLMASTASLEGLDSNRLGDQVFVLHLESVSAFVASEQTTPLFSYMAPQGISFPAFYSGSVQTLRAEEVLLCGLPPSLQMTLIDYRSVEDIERLPCLPRYFAAAGYRTLFFKDDALDFSGSGDFMKAIGFQEVHQADIMHTDDPKLPWGYREDVFLQRVTEYLERYQGEKLFVYVALSATNHYPFNDNAESREGPSLPYPGATTFVEQYENSVFVQDSYAHIFWRWFEERYAKTATLIVTPDHPWPVPRHGNINVEQGAYEENFLIPFAWVPPSNKRAEYRVGEKEMERWSHLDVMPTLLELGGVSCDLCLGESFAGALLREGEVSKPQKRKLSLQPYGGGLVSLVRYPEKIILDLARSTVTRFWLDRDPEELRPENIMDVAGFTSLIDEYFRLTSY